jgi:hypothetical protein
MWKRFSTYAIIVNGLAGVATAFLPYWTAASQLLKLNVPGEIQNAVFTVIGVHVTLLLITLTLLLLEQRDELTTAVTRIEQAVKGPAVRKLRDEDFYTEFLQAAKQARSSVCICYFGPHPPTTVPDAHRKKYYLAMRALMKKRGDDIRVRRLLRHSAENEKWAAEEVKKLLGKPKVDFALLTDLDPTNAKNVMPLALSVQIIDRKQAWLVAIRSHEQIGEHRDLVIEGSDVPEALQEYFDRLWHHADMILENGNLTPSGKALFERLGMNA